MKNITKNILFLALCSLFLQNCESKKAKDLTQTVAKTISNVDKHTYSDDGPARMTHLKLELDADFENKILKGTATIAINNNKADSVFFDARQLTIDSVQLNGKKIAYFEGKENEILGRKVAIKINPSEIESLLVFYYKSSPQSDALQWLDPLQTMGKVHPFLYTQGQAILTRTWIPIQDSPGIRFTYEAKIKTPKELMAVMSAENSKIKNTKGKYHFIMPQAIPAYLIALAIGDLKYHQYDSRSGVFAEPKTLSTAANEFSETPAMMQAAESLYGPYVWGQYDILVLPPAFPFGGMENPRLTFATPTVLAGDKSLSSLIAHELAHSWSGNLVTNATWNDFWLNEGFTVYFERRIIEKIKGHDFAEMSRMIGRGDLDRSLDEFGKKNPYTKLKLELDGKNPDDGVSDIAYEKGFLFLTLLEQKMGRDKFDQFLKTYFEKFKFKTMTTEHFEAYLNLKVPQDILAGIKVKEWLYGVGLQYDAPKFNNVMLDSVLSQAPSVLNLSLVKKYEDWDFNQWLYFIRWCDEHATLQQLIALDNQYHFSSKGNMEILAAWYELNIKKKNTQINSGVSNFLSYVGRRKFLVPLYTALIESGQQDVAKTIYEKARNTYHAVSRQTLDELCNYSPK